MVEAQVAIPPSTILSIGQIGLLVGMILLTAPSSRALDFTDLQLVYHETYVGEFAYPTSPEVDDFANGGMQGVGSPANNSAPTLTGGAAEVLVTFTGIGDEDMIQSTQLASAGIGESGLGLRGRFENLSQSGDGTAIASVSATALFFVLVIEANVLLTHSAGTVTSASLVVSQASSGITTSLQVSLDPADRALLAGGGSFTIDLLLDKEAATMVASVEIVGGGTYSTPALDVNGFSFVTARQSAGMAEDGSGILPDSVSMDLKEFEVYLPLGPSIRLAWGSTTGQGIPGSDSIEALPGDALTLDIFIAAGAAGSRGASVDLFWDPRREDGDFPTECPAPVFNICLVNGVTLTPVVSGVVLFPSSMESFDAVNPTTGFFDATLRLGEAPFSVLSPGPHEITAVTEYLLDGSGIDVTPTDNTVTATVNRCGPDLLVAHWPFMGNALDAGECSIDGTPIGATLSQGFDGAPSSAYSFDGNDYIDLGQGSLFSRIKSPLPVTIAMWIRHECSSGFCFLFNNDFSFAANYSGIWLQLIDGRLNANVGDGSGVNMNARRSVVGDSVIPAGVWTHVAAVLRSENDMDLYINGVPDVSTPSGNGGSMLYVGLGLSAEIGGDPSNSAPYSGDIDDVRVYARSLTEEEIIALPEPNSRVALASGLVLLQLLSHRQRSRSRQTS